MDGSRAVGGVASLDEVQARLTAWRRTHRRGARLPASLWEAAAAVARQIGVAPVCRQLRLDYYDLKRRVEAPGTGTLPGLASAPPAFIEVPLPRAPAALGECVLELEKPDGAKLRAQFTGHPLPDLAGLCAAFWTARS
jgi:hypothetical protein